MASSEGGSGSYIVSGGSGGGSVPVAGGGGGGSYSDSYGNYWPSGGAGNYTITTGGMYYPTAGGASNVLSNYAMGGSIYFNAPPAADSITLSRAQVSDLVDEMTTRIRPGERVVICVEHDVSSSQVEQLKLMLDDLHVEGVIVRGARASAVSATLPFSGQEQRVDYLARILDLWEQKPGMLLTKLLSFYGGQKMGDNEFVTAVETHFRMVTGQ